ncbi:MAG: hypothetical protein KAV48_01790 [Methanomicrobia archaeon]|nr:hypothetical protein [Methanomicrobia archaeon]
MFGKIGEYIGKIKKHITGREENFSNLAWLITVIDNYRVGKGVKREVLRDKLLHVHRKFDIPSWGGAYNDIRGIEKVLKDNMSNFRFYLNILTFTKFLVKQGLLIIFIFSFIGMLTLRPKLSNSQIRYLFYLVIAFAWIVVSLRAYVKSKVLDVYIRHQADYKKNQLKLRDYNQKLIDEMRTKMREENENPKRYKLVLYYNDYDNIEIVKEPNWLRDYYTGNIKIEEYSV